MKVRFYYFVLALLLSLTLFPQTSFTQGRQRIREIDIESNFDVSDFKNLILNQSGLRVGNPLSSDSASQAIRTLWDLDIFSDVRITSEQVENGLKVIIKVDVLPSINRIKTEGFDEYKEEEVLTNLGLVRNLKIGDRKIVKMKDQINAMYKEKGYLLPKVDFITTPVPGDSTFVDVLIKIVEGRKYKIKTINFEGNENLSDKKIKKEMETKEDRWYRSGDFKEDVFTQDKEKIIHLYKSEGYRDAIIARDSTYFDEDAGKIHLTIFVQEGRKYKFGKTTYEGNSIFTDDDLRALVKYSEDETFNEDMLHQSLYEMNVLYNNRGYLKTGLVPVQMAHGDTVDILIDIAEGNVSKVSKIIITGNTKTVEKVIRREIFLMPGDEFNRTLFDRSHRNIMSLNYFENVEPDYEPHMDSDDVDIVFNVTEKQTGVASMGAGYSERDKLVGTLSFSNSNLFGKGQGVNVSWDIGSRRKAFQLGFTEPWLFDTRTSFSFNVYNIVRSDYTSAFDQEQRRGGYIRLGRRLRWPDDYCRGYISYRLEDVNYTNPSEYYSLYLVTGKTSSVSFMLTRDSRDLPQFATDGSRTSATYEIAGGPLGGDLSYYKYLFNNEFYTPIVWQVSLIVRSRLGFLKGYKEDTWVPYSERFMPGGTSYDGFVRGYSNRQVCPLLSGEEIGGETMIVNNFELQFPIVAQMVYGLCFYDFGNAWRNLSETNPFDVKRSAGLGVRLAIPGLGMLGFDFGYGFDKLEGATKIGGWRTHFQFGNQFL
ncbi:MAG: outer membrane protein assembly factor BamA [Candidatus Latescibacteria bacterium]|nr:outer membrane protein assembly factor BamA [Candidatus Latescibacterota bacterium]